MERFDHYSVRVARWQSVVDLAEDGCNPRYDDQVKSDDYSIRLENMADVRQSLRQTWARGVEVVERLVASLADQALPRPRSRRRVGCWGDDGDELSRDRLEAGLPFWRTTKRESRTGPQSVTLIAEMATPNFYDSIDIIWRPASVIALATILEAAGIRCEIWAVSATDQSFHEAPVNSMMGVRCKEAGDALDVATLVAATSGWAYRSAWWGARMMMGAPSFGKGRPEAMREATLSELIGQTPDKTIIAGGLWDFEAAVAWLRSTLEKFA